MNFGSPEFWLALVQIIGVNIVLSGDNAVVIALAARGLPADQQRRAVAWGSGAAVVMRIVLTIVAVELLRLPLLKLAGSALLFWIAVKLLLPEDGGEGHGQGTSTMAAAVKTILLADLVMSLDNVIAVAAAAKGSNVLLVAGLAISIPLVVFASQLLLKAMDRFPIIITLGAALLGWVAGEMAIGDLLVKPWIDDRAPWLHPVAPLAGAVAVVLIGKWLAARKASHQVPDRGPSSAPADSRRAARRILVAVDGSPGAARALDEALALRERLRDGTAIELHLVNVQRPLSRDVADFIAAASVEGFHQERAEHALAPARARMQRAGLPAHEHCKVGEPGRGIASAALTEACELIVMGARGLGSHTGAVLGSVVAGTLQHAAVPVLVVRG